VYRDISRDIHAIFRRYTDLVEPIALDEAFLDVTKNHVGLTYASQVAKAIRREIFEELGLKASAGVSNSKFVAKLASDYRKPDALVVVRPEEVLDFIAPMPVRRLWGVGPATARKMESLGLKTIADVRERSRLDMERVMGGHGYFLRELAFGRDRRPVKGRGKAKSRGAERTFQEDLRDLRELNLQLEELAERVARALTKADRPARTISLKVRYDDFETITRSYTTTEPCWSADEIATVAKALMGKTEAGNRAIRLLGISCSNFDPDVPHEQLELPF